VQKVRLQKFLAECGVASRRKSEELIINGHVKVNGRVAQIGDSINPGRDAVHVRGKRIQSKPNKKIYIMLHKPRGYITTMSDEQGRKSVADLVRDVPVRVFPVGRLDKESEGLLLMTNDGDFANAVTHPSKHSMKTYRVTLKSKISDDDITKLTEGVMLDGEKTLPADISVVLNTPERSVIEMTIYEGKNRQIRRMCESLGLEVARLKRTKIGSLKLGMLKPGKYRDLTEKEIKQVMTSPKKKDFIK
jgi:23S rRNA pseudouridine2605 synthase